MHISLFCHNFSVKFWLSHPWKWVTVTWFFSAVALNFDESLDIKNRPYLGFSISRERLDFEFLLSFRMDKQYHNGSDKKLSSRLYWLCLNLFQMRLLFAYLFEVLVCFFSRQFRHLHSSSRTYFELSIVTERTLHSPRWAVRFIQCTLGCLLAILVEILSGILLPNRLNNDKKVGENFHWIGTNITEWMFYCVFDVILHYCSLLSTHTVLFYRRLCTVSIVDGSEAHKRMSLLLCFDSKFTIFLPTPSKEPGRADKSSFIESNVNNLCQFSLVTTQWSITLLADSAHG